jgi:pimeloyl-ACP methyl ester carboxylesterase
VIGCVVLGLFAAPALAGALSATFNPVPVSLSARGGIGSFTPASVDPRFVSEITSQLSGHPVGHGKLFRFTPAGMENRPDRAVTVAVRVTELSANGLSVRTAFAAGSNMPGTAPVRIAPMVYNLGLARGYQSFAASAAAQRDGALLNIERLDMPDLRVFGRKDAGSTATAAPSARLAPRLELDTKDRAGHAPRTYEGQGDYQVDLGGSYRLTRNIDVTAGVRYSPERDRLGPLTDGKKDSQAVYVGTQFRF